MTSTARDTLRSLVGLWWRAFIIVTCTALNVTNVSTGHYGMAFFTGGLLSWVWWGNTRRANAPLTGPLDSYAYAIGAACGTVTGMAIGRALGS